MSPGSDSDTLWLRAALSASGDIGKQQYPFSSRFAKAAVMALVGWLVGWLIWHLGQGFLFLLTDEEGIFPWD